VSIAGRPIGEDGRVGSEPFFEGTLRGPIKVVVVDVERGLPEIRAERASGGHYAGVWCLVRQLGSPVGLLELGFDTGAITADELADCLAPLLASERVAPGAPLDDELPFVSVVVPSLLGREAELRDCLAALSALDYPRFELLLVDNRAGTAGKQPAWLSEYPAVRVLSEPRPGISQARNKGLAAARGEIVAFTDDDVVVDPYWLRAIATRFVMHPEEVCVTGIALPRELETPAQLRMEVFSGGFGPRVYEPVTRRLLDSGRGRRLSQRSTVGEFDDAGHLLRTFPVYRASNFGAGANMAFRTDALRVIGGFDPLLGTGTPTKAGEDHKLFIQLICRGHSLAFEPAALVLHMHRRDDEGLRRQILGWGTGIGAMFSSIVLEDPRHLLAIAMTLPKFFRVTFRSYFARRQSTTPGPAHRGSDSLGELARLELRGFASGLVIYLRTRRAARRSLGGRNA
jgi:hypothetical protein